MNSSVVEDDDLAVALLTVTRGIEICKLNTKFRFSYSNDQFTYNDNKWHEIFKKTRLTMNGDYAQNYAGNQRDGNSQNTALTNVNSHIYSISAFPLHCTKC